MSQSMESATAALSRYELGRTASVACQVDQRFSYCLYVPKAYKPGGAKNCSILVALHGSDRGNAAIRDLFIPLAEELNCIVLCPLFPAGIIQPYEMDNYKYVAFEDIRFDEVVLHMVEEVGARYGVDFSRFALFGFSGGAHLAHRFLYLHPQRLSAVSICAPGSITLLDFASDWWVGVRDVQDRFGIEIDLGAIATVSIHLAVGLNDKDTSEITHDKHSPHWMDGANDAGVTRVDRLRTLGESLAGHAIPFQADFLEGVEHERDPLIEAASAFYRSAHKKLRA